MGKAYSALHPASNCSRSPAVDEAIVPIYTKLYDLVVESANLSPFEQQLSYCMIASCIMFCSQYGSDCGAECLSVSGRSPGEVLDAMAEAFMFQKLGDADLSPFHTTRLRSIALGMGCCCFLPISGASSDLRTKGHVILYDLTHRHLRVPFENDAAVFAQIVEESEEPLWGELDAFCKFAREAYKTMFSRQRQWEDRGLFKLGIPQGDRVEYMVLRSFRGESAYSC
jgi:hypothetical protein